MTSSQWCSGPKTNQEQHNPEHKFSSQTQLEEKSQVQKNKLFINDQRIENLFYILQ